MAPINIRIKIINSMVPKLMRLSSKFSTDQVLYVVDITAGTVVHAAQPASTE